MKRTVAVVGAILVIALLLLPTGSAMQEKIKPSDALKKVQELLNAKRATMEIKTYEKMVEVRTGIALELMPQVQTEGLEPAEKLAWADYLGLAGKPEEALALYRALKDGADASAREAHKNYLNGLTEKLDVNLATAETELAAYRSRYKPDPADSFGLYSQVVAIGRHYMEKGENEKAIATYEAEIAWLTLDAPYFSFSLVGGPKDAWMALGRKQEAVARIDAMVAKMQAIVDEREKNIPTEAEAKTAWERQTGSWKGQISGMEANKTQMLLQDAPAPGFNFSHFFNTEPFNFKEKTAGKVVLIDFWATWCGPCIATFPHMREFYAEYAPKGVVVIGVTGFQGNMSNHGKDRVQNLSEEQELALMPEFIKHQNVTWPLALSDRNCYDPAYGIRGVPTAVIIDKKGNVRMFTHPYYQDKLRAMVDKLLAE